MALSAAVAGLAIVATQGGSASAANVSQVVDCGIGGSQTMALTTTAPATATLGSNFHVKIAPSSGGTASGAEIKNMVTSFQIPSGATYVTGSAALSGGSGTLGATSVSVSGGVIQVKVPGPVANGASFTNPTLDFDLTASGTVGQTLKMTFKQTGAYTLTAAGSISVSCNANTPLTTLTSTVIEAAATTTTQATTTTSAGTTTTGGGASTTTQATTTTTAGPTTTLPPVVTTQNWVPGTACGVPEITTAPANATAVTITAVGGKGGKGGSQASSSKYNGGDGGQAVGTFAVTGGQTLSAVVGCNGADGQNGTATSTAAAGWSYGGSTGNGYIVIGQTGAGGGGGGGSSAGCLGADCATGSGTPLVVAGGGGGAGVSNCAGTPAGAGGTAGAASNANGDGGYGPSGTKGGNGGNSGS
ncbi:MAG: hypothetical protein KDA94_06370, partial [Acidimicrobiales bacterium]|nr:hypothetical protein [Acidimicrobiales bacterium]